MKKKKNFLYPTVVKLAQLQQQKAGKLQWRKIQDHFRLEIKQRIGSLNFMAANTGEQV